MPDICIYFQVHQPNRLRKYSYFDIGYHHDYEDDQKNRNILLKVAQKCYLPTNALLLKLINEFKGDFKVAFSISGIAIEQFKKFNPEVLDSFKRLSETGHVEFLNETYYHSLSFLFSKKEFKEQVKLHQNLIQKEFGYKATTFRNTELVYNNELAEFVEKLGYQTILAEGADKILEWRSPNFVYRPKNCKKLKKLLKNYRLSDDIAFRFSERSWKEFPLTADKYAHWVHNFAGSADVINLFMDYETFGEHQWEDSGIFNFLNHLPREIFKHPDFGFVTPNEASRKYQPVAELDVPYFVSWADIDRDLSAWCGNALQEDALKAVYGLEEQVKATKDEALLAKWRSLLTSDHFYYMCTKWFNDGDVHAYFNPYDSPYEAYMTYQNVLSDFKTILMQ
ncbi:MAG: glycoside hydrolase family 57 protein [Gammaproteobacteria bacterium]|nr:glycoside hydrolase family 57 protein [Gammaproteobacteria bacterium]